MNHHPADTCTPVSNEQILYGELSIIELAERIVQHGDRSALKEFHDYRTLFKIGGSPSMLFVDFIDELRSKPWVLKWIDHNQLVLETAYDLTVDKFSHIPSEEKSGERPKKERPDCRHYFKAFLGMATNWRANTSKGNPMLEEVGAARVFQKLVIRHFRLSCMEALRGSNPMMSRYAWPINGAVINVMMPTSMTGRKRAEWLTAHVKNPDPQRGGEKQRVQSIINERLGRPRHVGLTRRAGQDLFGRSADTPLEVLMEREIHVHGMASVVAEEKAECIAYQRPAIQALGESSLKKLICQVFETLSTDQYEEKRIAERFGLSRPTFSRFAGSRWRNDPSSRPPDLWRNVAQTLAGHATFVEKAKEAGVWPKVKEILNENPEEEA